jgi:hypothetical protein
MTKPFLPLPPPKGDRSNAFPAWERKGEGNGYTKGYRI